MKGREEAPAGRTSLALFASSWWQSLPFHSVPTAKGREAGRERTHLTVGTRCNTAHLFPGDDFANIDPGSPVGLHVLLDSGYRPQDTKRSERKIFRHIHCCVHLTLRPTPLLLISPCGASVPWEHGPQALILLLCCRCPQPPRAQLWGHGSLPLWCLSWAWTAPPSITSSGTWF